MVPVFDSRDRELFDALTDEDVPHCAINHSLLPKDLATEIQEIKETVGFYGFSEVNLADLGMYIVQNPEVPDYDADWGPDGKEKVYKDNPVCKLYELVLAYIRFANKDSWMPLSAYKVLYWFDC